MWHPPERIQHQLPPPHWPTADEAAAAAWFQPITIGSLKLGERTWVPAMVPWRATEEGYVTQDVLDWYERLARGQPGAIVVEATGVRDIPSGPLLRIGHDRFIPGLTQLVETVRRASRGTTRLLIQIIDFLAVRRRPSKEKYFERYFELREVHLQRLQDTVSLAQDLCKQLAALSDEALAKILEPNEFEALQFGYRERVTDVHLPQIRELPQVLPATFASAAVRAEQAGFDGVELHYAHAYTMASFLSATNTREDGYGGSRQNRIRLPLEVYRAVRNTVSPHLVVGCRFLADECIAQGSHVDDATWFGVEFARAGMDYLSLSRGGKFDDAKQPAVGWAAYPYTGPSGYECIPTSISDPTGPFGRNVTATSQVRHAIRQAGFQTPIVVTGGICTFEQAEAILKHGDGDIVGAARQTLADPDWFKKIRLGRGAEIRRCTYTNYCEGLDQKHKAVTCKLWDREGLDEPNVKLSADGRRRLVAPVLE